MDSRLKDILSTSIYFLSVLAVAFLLIKYVGQRTEVNGNSMNETLFDGDNLILNKISYRFHDPERFDIVVFPFRDGSSKTYIKRVIGLPGETVQILEDGTILINDEELIESYGNAIIKDPGNAAKPIKLNDNQYFVMGDNRNDSSDSRFNEVGIVNRKEILGKVWVRFYPFTKIGVIK